MENVKNDLLVKETKTDEKHELGLILCSQDRDFLVSNNGEQLKELEEEAKKNQSLKSLLVSQTRDYVIDPYRTKIPVSSLVGKHVLFYFSAHHCSPCRAFLPKFIQAYKEINKKNNNSLEVIFLSSDRQVPCRNAMACSSIWRR